MAAGVRWATTEDAAALAAMLRRMAAYYRQPELDAGKALSAARLWLEDESPAYPHFALAFVEGEVRGLASVAIAHPGIDLRRLMVLKDLFVTPEARGRGVGRALLAFLARHCLQHDIGRIDLTADTANDGAQRLYARLGATRMNEKVSLRFDGDALAALAKDRG